VGETVPRDDADDREGEIGELDDRETCYADDEEGAERPASLTTERQRSATLIIERERVGDLMANERKRSLTLKFEREPRQSRRRGRRT
jgi:hypothetical protein